MRTKAFKADTVFVFVNFAVFTASMLLTLLFGAGIYKSIIEKNQEGHDQMACVSYLRTMARAADTAGSIYAGEFCGLSALYLEEDCENTAYLTTIYLYDGWVRELFYETGLEFAPGDGMPVIMADSLTFEQLDSGAIKAKVNSESLLIYPRSTQYSAANSGPAAEGERW